VSVLLVLYPWVKSLHVISLIAWMAALLYLPRLFVYHCDLVRGSAESERFKVMEYRLMKLIMNPAMIATWVFGLTLMLTPGVVDWHAGWWHVKLTCVILMSGVHGVLSARRRAFQEDRNTKPQRYFRILNEVPAALMVVIVVMVIVKPF
jgi:putative membrane protein